MNKKEGSHDGFTLFLLYYYYMDDGIHYMVSNISEKTSSFTNGLPFHFLTYRMSDRVGCQTD